MALRATARPSSSDPRYLDINKPLKFHYEKTILHWSEASATVADAAAVPGSSTRTPLVE